MPVAQGVTAIWSGTLASIPANWVLCDGNNSTPNLLARFIKGAAAGAEAGGTGGSDTHNHTVSAAGDHTHSLGSGGSHTHTVNSSGSHTHKGSTNYGQAGTGAMIDDYKGSHAHTTTTGTSSHTHTSGASGTHTHTINAGDGRPPFYEVAYIMSNGSAEITTGIIIIWTGLLVDIPTGWALCNGTSSPDLRSKFIRGINSAVTNPGTTGGSATHNHTESSESHTHSASDSQGAHTHGFSAYSWVHTHAYLGERSGSGFFHENSFNTSHTHATSNSTGAHTHTLSSAGSHTHTINTSSSIPSYYDVAYIISVSATSLPLNGIIIWTNLLANIPNGYLHCNGTGTPDLRSKYLRGSNAGVNPGGTGGSNTHTHTDENNSNHTDHTVSSSGDHKHSSTDSIGAHTHSTSAVDSVGGYSDLLNVQASQGAHSHTYNSEAAHTDHAVGSQSAAHNHNDWSTDSGEPAYSTVQFILFLGEEACFGSISNKLVSARII